MEKSEKLWREASERLAGGVNSPVRSYKSVGGTPRFISSGRGCRIRDEDGKTYVDYCMSWGALLFGHAPEGVVRAVQKTARSGLSFGACTRLEVEMARAVQAAFPSLERLRFVSSGTEACMSAIRAARGFTGRDLLLKFEGGYHGHSDGLLVKAGSGAAALGSPDSAGVPADYARNTLVAEYNNLSSVEALFSAHAGKISAVIVEPVAANMGVVPPEPGFLAGLRSLCDREGALLIFDEVITGFRLAAGGAQEVFSVRPDLTCLGKILGGGMPVACYGGRREIMDKIAPLGPVYQAGTLSGNPVAMAAGIATLEHIFRKNPYPELEEKTRMLCDGIARVAAESRVPVRVQRAGSMFTVFFCEKPVRNFREARAADAERYGKFFHALLEEGVYFPPSPLEACFLSTEHGEGEIRKTVAACRRALSRI